MTRRPEFDFLYPHNRVTSKTDVDVPRSTTTASVENQATTTKEDMEEGDLLLEAYVHRSRTEELEKRLHLQQSTHFTAAADLQARISCLEGQLDKQATELSQKDIDLAQKRGRCKELIDENAQLQAAKDDCQSELRALGDTNDALGVEINLKENAISNLEEELKTLREDFATREQALISKVSSLDQSLSDLRIQLEESQTEKNNQLLLLSQIRQEMRVAKDNEAMAKERLICTEKECADKIASVTRREADAIAAATGELSTRLQLAEERAQIAEKREETANAIRRKAEIEATDVRTKAEEQLCRAKQQVKDEYEILLQSKDDELAAMKKVREADAMQTKDLRNAFASQANDNKNGLESHMEKINQLSSDLHQARKDLDSERRALSELKIDLGNTQTRLDGAMRQGHDDKRAWEHEKMMLEDEMSILQEEMDIQKKNHEDELAGYVEKIRLGREREVELERRIVDKEKKYQTDRERLLKGAEDAIRNVFTTGMLHTPTK